MTGVELVYRLVNEHVRPYFKRMGLAIICMVVVAAATALNAWLMQPVLDDIFLDKNRDMLLIIPAVVLAIAVIKGAAHYGQNYLMQYIGQRIICDMQLRLYGHLLHADMAEISKHASGKLISRFTNDIQILRMSVSSVLTGIAKESLTLVFLVGLMFYQSWTLSLIVFVVFPVAIYPIMRLGRRMRKLSRNTQEELGNFTEHLDETFQGIRIIKAYQREDFEEERASSILEKLFGLYAKSARTSSASSPIMESLGGIAIASVIWYGGTEVISGTTTPGAFFSFIAALIMAYKPMKSLSNLNTQLQEGLASATRLFAMIDTEAKVIDQEKAKDLKVKAGLIQFNKVSFSYNDEKSALHQLSLDVPAGKTVALVGPSGGGKSTIINLILRYYDPQKGTVKIDGTDIKKVKQHSLRNQIALVSQDITLFDDTVMGNIGYGDLDATEDKILDAAQAAAAHEFIIELPQGYDTEIGQHGFMLSGGQRQRLAIARAMLKDAPILLLDEATSALDPVSEDHIQEALAKLKKGRTTLVIAHRLSTVVDADLIYVIKKGKVIEQGTHEELLEQKGEYRKLYKVLDKD